MHSNSDDFVREMDKVLMCEVSDIAEHSADAATGKSKVRAVSTCGNAYGERLRSITHEIVKMQLVKFPAEWVPELPGPSSSQP